MTAAPNSEARKRAAEAQATSWIDRHGDVWHLGDDGLLHTPETAPFSREHVEKKWGPLRPVVDLLSALQDSIDAAKAPSNSESPLSQPIPDPVDSGAIGRLNEAEIATCACGHRVVWHHEARGCGYHGFSERDRTERRRTFGQTATHCKHGHEFDEENTYITTIGGRACRTCRREAERARFWRQKDAS